MTILQLIEHTEQAGISANWFFGSIITVLLLIIGFFLQRNLAKMDDMLQRHDEQLNRHASDIEVLKYSQGDNVRIGNEILEKLRAITPQ